jgi:hypothetical protein
MYMYEKRQRNKKLPLNSQIYVVCGAQTGLVLRPKFPITRVPEEVHVTTRRAHQRTEGRYQIYRGWFELVT